MKLSAGAVSRFLKNPDPDINIVLLYGPDHGLIKERARAIEHVLLGKTPGPFAQTSLTDADIKNDPASLQDALCAQPLGGGPSVVRLKASSEQSAKPLKFLLAALSDKQIIPAAFLLIEAGDLSPRSALRKCVEQENTHAATIACYAPSVRDLHELAMDIARVQNLTFADGTIDFLVSRLPQDRAMARSEIEKLALYAAKNDGGLVETTDVQAVIADSQGHNLDAFTSAVADGSAKTADRLLVHALEAGQSPIALLRALQRHFLRLSEARSAINAGKDAKSAMASLRPPVFFTNQNSFSRQLSSWRQPALERVIEHCLSTERAMKRSGALPENLLARLIIKISSIVGVTNPV